MRRIQSKDIKDYYDEHEDEYDEARVEALAEHIKDGEDPEDFSFPDKDQWLSDKFESMLGGFYDQAYEEKKERVFDDD